MERTQTIKKNNIYEEVTRRIVMRLAEGDIPWRKGWATPSDDGMINFVSRKQYNGINRLLLDKDGEWLTFKQCEKAGGKIMKGHPGHLIVKYGFFVPKEHKEEAKKLEAEGKDFHHLEQIYDKKDFVWHISECEGIASKIEKVEMKEALNPIDLAELIIRDYCNRTGVKVVSTKTDECGYKSSTDTVVVPCKEQFHTEEEYYNAIFSGLIQSTATENRCDREPKKDGQKVNKVKEELINEIGASMTLCGVGLDRKEAEENTAAVCQKWIKELNNDLRLIVTASRQAEKATKLLLAPILPSEE